MRCYPPLNFFLNHNFYAFLPGVGFNILATFCDYSKYINKSLFSCLRYSDETKKSGRRLIGDVHFEEARKRASWITPVPGGR